MYFKIQRTGFYKEIGPHRDGEMLELDGEFLPWLGIIDRAGARSIPGCKPVALDFAGWKLRETDGWVWLREDVVIVGCRIQEGVMAVIEYRKPMLRKRRPTCQ